MRVDCLAGAVAAFFRSFPPALALGVVLGTAPSMRAAAKPLPDAQVDLTSLSIEELLAVEVYSASKFVQKTTEAPAVVTISSERESGATLDNSSRHLAKLNLSLPAWGDRPRAGDELQYASSRKTVAGGSVGGRTIAEC